MLEHSKRAIYVPKSHHSCLYRFGQILYKLKLADGELATISNKTSDSVFWQRFKEWRQVFEAYNYND